MRLRSPTGVVHAVTRHGSGKGYQVTLTACGLWPFMLGARRGNLDKTWRVWEVVSDDVPITCNRPACKAAREAVDFPKK